ncbi:30S ribosomal protein S17 [Candidatus Parcubacteria bacterium]|nr:30S ribosomal protein S17 [Patescibacteria group bacterium]MBU4482137.1 30S ribosomal protein S17 [Patescibacteria group bacterium]MCG2687068.1 30S ribosomal protein S17 [Candidatus Parcubacteria bacterium]
MKQNKKTPSFAKATEDKKQKKIIKRTFTGTVVSDKMNKTIVVKVDRTKIHPKYHKRYTISKNYKVHDEKNKFKIKDKISFVECRPLSKDKRWRVA